MPSDEDWKSLYLANDWYTQSLRLEQLLLSSYVLIATYMWRINLDRGFEVNVHMPGAYFTISAAVKNYT